MTQQLKQSQTAEPLLFLMVQSADHITPLTGASPTVTLSKNGAAFGAPAGAVTEVANGWYKVAGNATDTGTLGLLVLHATATSGDPSDAIYQVVGGDPESASVVASSVTGAVGSVTGAVGSVTGNVGGNVVGSTGSVTGAVGSVTGAVGSVTGNVGGNVVGSVASVTAAVSLVANDSLIIQTGTAQAGAGSTITLAAGASATDGLYVGELIILKSGTGAGQVRVITAYVGSTRVATVSRAWAANPDSTSVYVVLAAQEPNTDASLRVNLQLGYGNTIRSGVAQAGAASTITLDSTASATDSIYVGCVVLLTFGTGVNQARVITAYVGSTKVATVDRAWVTNPDSTSGFALQAVVTPALNSSLQPTAASVAGAVGSVTAAVTVGTNNDKTGYTASTVSDKTGYSLAADQPVNVTKVGGTTQTARDLGASVLISPGTGTGQLDVTSGVIKANLAQILGTALTETAGQIAAAFKKYFDIASPTSTANVITTVTGVTNDVGITQAGADKAWSTTTRALTDKVGFALSGPGVQAIWDALTANLTTANSIGKRIADDLDTNIGSRVASVSLPTNFSLLAIDASGFITPVLAQQLSQANGTAQAGAGSTITLAAGASATDQYYRGNVVAIQGGTGAGQARAITGYVGSTKVATVGRAWTINPDATSVYTIWALPVNQVDDTLRVLTQPASTIASVSGAVASVTADVGITQSAADKVWGTTVRALTDKVGFALSGAGVQAIWDALTSALTTVGSIGKRVVDNLDTNVGSRLATSGYTAPDNADIASILARTDVATSTRADGAHYTNARGDALDELLAANIPADVDGLVTGVNVIQWRGATPDVLSSGKLPADIKLWLATAPAALNNSLVQADVERWLNVIPAAYAVPDNADIVLIKAKTDNLPADPASNTEVDTRLATAGYTVPPSTAAIVTAILDGLLTGHSIADSVAAALRSASSSGDPWGTAVPGAYASGSAGYIVGHNLDTNVGSRGTGDATAANQAAILARTDVATSTRLATAGYTAPDNADIVLIKAKTDNLPVDPASNTEVDTRLATSGYTAPPTPAAIDAEFTGVHGAGTWQQGNTVVPANAAILAAIAAIPAPATVDAIWRDDVVYPDGSKGAELALTSVGGDPLRTDVPGSYPIGSAGYNLGLLATGQVTVISPLSVDGKTLYLIPGMTYQAERGTGILWTLPVGAPDLSGATSYIIDIGYPRKPVLQTACNYSRDGGGVQRLALELTSAQTDSLPDGGGTCAFAIWARWSDSDTDAVPAVTGVAILEKALP